MFWIAPILRVSQTVAVGPILPYLGHCDRGDAGDCFHDVRVWNSMDDVVVVVVAVLDHDHPSVVSFWKWDDPWNGKDALASSAALLLCPPLSSTLFQTIVGCCVASDSLGMTTEKEVDCRISAVAKDPWPFVYCGLCRFCPCHVPRPRGAKEEPNLATRA